MKNRFYCSTSNNTKTISNSLEEIGVAEESRTSVASWLILSAGFVFGIVSVGGLTRLMDAGLSITDWKPVTGIIPPITEEEWEHEFNKYKQFPEYKVLFSDMKMDEFKKIFFMEWLHRVLGRSMGIIFGVPFLYFAARKKISKGMSAKLLGIFALGGAQGALGWYMVKSGLEEKYDGIPRVSPYRLCAHLGSAFVIYLGILWVALGVMRPTIVLKHKIPGWFKYSVGGVMGLTFTTAMSGAFVAGLDAGLVHNEFPKMGEGYVPETYWDLQPAWKNFFENDAAVQFNHRVLGISTLTAITTLWALSPRKQLPRPTRHALNAMLGMSWLQATLGLTTLLWFVPTPLAAAHQAGSLTLLTFATWALHTLRRKPLPIKRI